MSLATPFSHYAPSAASCGIPAPCQPSTVCSQPVPSCVLPAAPQCVPVCTPAPPCPPAPMCSAPCAPTCPPGYVPVQSNTGAAVGAGIITFMVIWLFLWVVFYSYNPWFVRRVERGEKEACDGAPPCASRVFVASLVAALILAAVIWLICACR